MDLSNFTNVGGNSVNWEPKQTGTAKDSNLKQLEPNKKSHIVGYYLGTDHDQGKDKTSQVHKIKLVQVGDPDHLSGEAEEGDTISIWGTSVLNSRIVENITIGQCILILWKGKQEPKKKGGRPYHTWEVMVNPDVEPILVGAQLATPAAEPAVSSTEATGNDMESDDLPF